MGLRDVKDLHYVWYHKIVPLLEEYFYNDGERLKVVLGDTFIIQADVDDSIKQGLGDLYDPDEYRYKVMDLSDEEFLEALRHLSIA